MEGLGSRPGVGLRGGNTSVKAALLLSVKLKGLRGHKRDKRAGTSEAVSLENHKFNEENDDTGI